MKSRFLKHISELIGTPVTINDDSNSEENVKNFFEDFYNSKSVDDLYNLLEKYDQMSKADKDGLVSDCEQLDLDFNDLFDYPKLKEDLQQADENSKKIMKLTIFFYIFQDSKIQSQLPLANDDELDSPNPDLPTLIQQFNFYKEPNFPIGFYLDDDMIPSLKTMIEEPNLTNIESIANNVFIQYVLKKYILDNPGVLFDDLINYINDQLENDYKEEFSNEKFHKMTLLTFKSEIYDPWINIKQLYEKKSSFNKYDYESNGKSLEQLFQAVNSAQNQIPFTSIIRILEFAPSLDKIAEGYSLYSKDKNLFASCPFFSFEIIENSKEIKNYIDSKQSYNTFITKRLIEFKDSKIRDLAFSIQPKLSLTKNFLAYIDLLFLILLSCEDQSKNIYNIVVKFFEDDEAFSSLKGQANNSCVIGEKKEALYKLMFIIDWLKSGSNNSSKNFNAFVMPRCQYLDNSKDEFNIENSINLIISNRKFFQEIIDGKVPKASTEYHYVMCVQNNEYNFAVDLNGVTLESPIKSNQVVEYVKLKLIASSLNITMFESRRDFEFQKTAMKFVSRFQLCEKLKTELKLLSNYYDERAQAKLLFKLEDDENEEEEEINDNDDMNSLSLKSHIAKIVNARLEIEKNINNYYVDSMTFFTKENLCLSYSYALKKDKENLKNIILSTINKESIRKDDFIDPEIDKICNELSSKEGSYEKKLGYYLDLLNNFMEVAISKEIYKAPKPISNQESQMSIASFKRRIMEKTISILQYTEYQFLPDFIFDLFFSFQQEMPNYNQLLFCTKDTTINRVSCFLQFYFMSNHSQKVGAASNFKLFLLINPQDLERESSEYLLKHIRKYSSDILGAARLVILSSTRSNAFIDIYRLYNIDNIDNCRYQLNKNCKSLTSTEKTESYMIYTLRPRVGKSHLIMKDIFEKFKDNNVYHRINIDLTTTLTRLIKMLKEVPLIDGRTICYHFNIEGSKNEPFMIYITMLYLFGSLNDGLSTPFVLSNKNKTVFYFEFSAHPPMTEEKFIEEVFPVGKYIKTLKLPEDREFFSLHEYCVSHENGFSTIIFKEFNRKELLETYALIEMKKNHGMKRFNNDYFKKFSDEDMRNERAKFMENGKIDPKMVYDNVLSLFKQEWIPDEYRNLNPLISQLDDVSHVIVNLIQFIFSFTTYQQESSIKPIMPIRYMSLSLVLETAIINCGLPYIYSDNIETEIDKIRLDRIKKWFDSAERLLVVTGLNYRHLDSCGVRTIQHSNRVRHKKTIKDEFGIDIQGGLENLIYTPETWKQLEKDNVKILQELEPIFELKRVGFLSSFVICVYLWDKLSNQDKKSLEALTRKYNDYFQQLRNTTNFNIKKHKHLFPENPTPACIEFVKSIAHIFRYQRDLPEIADEKITTFAKAVDVIQQYALSNTLLKTYSLTLHNIESFLHIVYRVYSQLPIVMMGETGSGKTYSVKLLREIIGPLTVLEIRCFDGGAEEDDIKSYVNDNIEKFIAKNGLEKIEKEQLQLIFFFDEVNTAPCQWFIKDLVIDRFLNGKKLPEFVKFICAMNPKRQLPDIVKQRLRGLEQKSQSELSNLVYKVRQMPESFVPYLFSADAPRVLPKGIENVKDYEDLSEFEKVTEKVIDQELNEEPLPLNHIKDNRIIHFSQSSSYSTCFNFMFFTNNSDKIIKDIFKDDTSIKTQLTHAFISRLNAYAGRLFIDKEIGIYKDESFMSIREPKRCVHLMRWFYKRGIFAFAQNNTNSKILSSQIFRMSFMLAFAVTYWLRLSDYKIEKQIECDRDSFIKKIIKKWEELIQSKDFKFLEPILKPPTFDEWINGTIKAEQQKYADLFVNDDEGLSKNDALCENIWATYISLSNNIPLWIIGRPGTSKSLAVNIVLAKLFTGRTIPNVPTLVYQTFMCSSDSRSEALISQMSRIAEKSLLLPTQGSITALLLEEIGHADLSPYLPLKCLNHIIDDGFQMKTIGKDNKEHITNLMITLIGLSNYKMDSAKLNRGILIIRDELSNKQKQKTALDIFRSTALSLYKLDNDKVNDDEINNFVERYREKIEGITKTYHNANKSDQFTGLRDFYGVIKLVTSVLHKEGENNMNRIIYSIKRNFSGDKTSLELFRSSVSVFETKQYGAKKITSEPSSLDLIRDNLSEDWSSLKNPLSRHMLIVTEGNSALSLLISELQINCLIYADNFSGLPDDEWISNDLKQFAKSMTAGETIVFIGNHPCFNCLYDVFNLRYENIYGENFALISFAGDSFLVKVHPHFKVIIIMEEKEYESLPAPFLNRFEKLFLNYDYILSQDKKDASENYEAFIKSKFPDFKVNSSFPSLKEAPQYYFGCYNQHHFNAITYCKDQLKLNQDEVDQLVFLNCQPSKAVVALTKYNQRQIQYLSNILNKLSSLKSSILHILYFYNNPDYLLGKNLASKFYDYWKNDEDKIPGIQATLLCPFYQNLMQDNFQPFGELIYIQLSEKINEGLIYSRIKKCMKKSNNIITLIEVQIPGENLQQRIYHLQAVFEKIRKELASDSLDKSNGKKNDISLHTFILVEMRVWENDLSFVQSVEWPVIFLDTCVSSNLKPVDNSLQTMDISSIIFNPLIKMFTEESDEKEKKGSKKKKANKPKRCDDKINLDEFFKIVKNDLLLIYTKEKRKLLSMSLSNSELSDFLSKYFLFLVSKIRSFNLCLSTSENKKVYNEENLPWFMNFLRSLYSPPPSLIEYLSVKLTRVAENIYSTLVQTIISCADDFKPDLGSQKNIDVINFIFLSDAFQDKLENSILAESPQMSQIEYRYLNPKKVPMWQMFKYMWEIVIYDSGQILNPDKNLYGEEEEEEEWKEEEEEEGEKILTSEIIEDFFASKFEIDSLINTYLKPKNIPDPFYAAYILLICPGISVNSSDRKKFDNLINCIKLIVASVYGKKLSLSKTMMVLLNKSLKSYLAAISQCYIFIPEASKIEFLKYDKNLDEDEQSSNIQQNISFVVKHILTNVFDYEFKNIIELKNFFTFGYPVIRSLTVEFNYSLNETIWDFGLMNSILNILSLYNLMFLMLPENVVLKDSMWTNKKLNVDINNPPKSSDDIIAFASDVMKSIQNASNIDEKEVTKIYKTLVTNYSNYMSKSIYHGFCDPELD